MPAAVAIPLITAGVSGGATIAGAMMNSSANREAGNLNYQAMQQALADARAQRAWQQQQYGNTLQRLAPYSQAGAAGISIAQRLLQNSPYATTGPGYNAAMAWVPPGMTPADALKGPTNG